MHFYLWTFEFLILAVLAVCLWHAGRRGWQYVWQICCATVFGWLLEWATIEQLQFYEYGPFFLRPYGVPLAIGMGWGIIIYAGRLFADATDLPRPARPVLVALFGLNIDLSMDCLAIRLDMWHWGMPIDAEFFGVPFGNFWAWYWVIVSFTTTLELVPGKSFSGRFWAPVAAILVGLITVVATNALIRALHEVSTELAWGVIFALLVWAVCRVLRERPSIISRPAFPAVLVPAVFHAYFLIAGLISGALFDPPWLLVPTVTMIALAWWMHRPPSGARNAAPLNIP